MEAVAGQRDQQAAEADRAGGEERDRVGVGGATEADGGGLQGDIRREGRGVADGEVDADAGRAEHLDEGVLGERARRGEGVQERQGRGEGDSDVVEGARGRRGLRGSGRGGEGEGEREGREAGHGAGQTTSRRIGAARWAYRTPKPPRRTKRPSCWASDGDVIPSSRPTGSP